MGGIYEITLESLHGLFPNCAFELYNQNGEYIDIFNDLDETSESKYKDYIVIYGNAKRSGVVYVEIYIEED